MSCPAFWVQLCPGYGSVTSGCTYPVPFRGSADLLALNQFAHGTSVSFAQGVIDHPWLARLDATTEALRHAAEDTPSGAKPDDVEKVPVFDRAGLAPKI
jgi:hypothetical protein